MELSEIMQYPQGPIALPNDPAAEDPGLIRRELGDVRASRSQLVSKWTARVRAAREYWTKQAFRQMIEDQRFASGDQWSSLAAVKLADGTIMDDTAFRYVANITLRHVQQRTASIYGKNPTIVARRKERMNNVFWDGSQRTLMTAMQALSTGLQDPNAMGIVQDAMRSMAESAQQDKIAKTLQLMFQHEIDEQPVPFKTQMKATVRRGLTTGVGYVKLGYQRVMGLKPEVGVQVENLSQQLAALERLASDREAGDFTDDDARMEELRVLIAALSKNNSTTVREGLSFTYPDSTAIIPDIAMKQLRGFVGAEWVAEEYFLTADKIKEIYKVDVSASALGPDADLPLPYDRTLLNEFRVRDNKASNELEDCYHCVWEIYNQTDGQVYVVCDGYKDFLVEPASPDIKLERFYPWFAFVVNEVYAPDAVFPPSDVRLIRDMQLELNRARQGLREHRRAARPRTYTRKGVLEDPDKEKLRNAEAHEVVELMGLAPSEKIQDVLQDYSGPRIDPALYDPSPAFEDYLRVAGQQEANLGGTSGATATESAIAESSRGTNVSAVVDDLDEFLSELARAAGQVLLTECSAEKVQATLGMGAVWPTLSAEQIAREIYLDVEASSTGRPNKAQEIQNAQQIFPLLMQIPNIDPEWLAKELLRRLDDKMDLTDAFASNMPSIQMMNAARGPAQQGTDPASAPNAQGPNGGNNAPSTDPGQVNQAPRPAGPEQMGGMAQAPV
jgi:hypothetical protein